MFKPVQPEDIVKPGTSTGVINGQSVKAGSLAAFLQNIKILDNPQATIEEKQEVEKVMRELAPVMVSFGLHEAVTFRNPIAEIILMEASEVMKSHGLREIKMN